MTLPNIISFSGRKGSGKTELAKVCIKYGYYIINFADELKKLVSECLNITLDDLDKLKDTVKIWDLSGKTSFMSQQLEINETIINQYCKCSFKSIREILQVIGTDIIRRYNPDWHINKTIKYIIENKDKRFCIGDCRFINEKTAIKKLGGECWFIIRPEIKSISNHSSETELNWSYFEDKIIINNIEKKCFVKKWDDYLYKLQSNYCTNEYPKDTLLLYPTDMNCYLAGFLKGFDIVIKNNVLIIQQGLQKGALELSKLKKLKTILKTQADENYIEINNPYIIENIKLWNVLTDKTEIPNVIKGNINYLKHWVVGLIDGCGKINSQLDIEIYCSKTILEYICLNANIIVNDNLVLKDECAMIFVKWLGNAIHFSYKFNTLPTRQGTTKNI
jgi:hypothetical protein